MYLFNRSVLLFMMLIYVILLITCTADPGEHGDGLATRVEIRISVDPRVELFSTIHRPWMSGRS